MDADQESQMALLFCKNPVKFIELIYPPHFAGIILRRKPRADHEKLVKKIASEMEVALLQKEHLETLGSSRNIEEHLESSRII